MAAAFCCIGFGPCVAVPGCCTTTIVKHFCRVRTAYALRVGARSHPLLVVVFLKVPASWNAMRSRFPAAVGVITARRAVLAAAIGSACTHGMAAAEKLRVRTSEAKGRDRADS